MQMLRVLVESAVSAVACHSSACKPPPGPGVTTTECKQQGRRKANPSAVSLPTCRRPHADQRASPQLRVSNPFYLDLAGMPRVIHVGSVDEWEKHMQDSKGFGGKAIVVDFTASWCGPCKAIGPIFDKLSDDFPTVTFLKVDVDELQDIARSEGIKAMPTFMSYLNGAKVDELTGADPARLHALIDNVAKRVMATGAGRKVGAEGTSAAAPDSADERRKRMAEAAEARMKAMQP